MMQSLNNNEINLIVNFTYFVDSCLDLAYITTVGVGISELLSNGTECER